MLERDNVVAPEALGLAALGVDHATGMAAIAPSYLWRYRVGGQSPKPRRTEPLRINPHPIGPQAAFRRLRDFACGNKECTA